MEIYLKVGVRLGFRVEFEDTFCDLVGIFLENENAYVFLSTLWFALINVSKDGELTLLGILNLSHRYRIGLIL